MIFLGGEKSWENLILTTEIKRETSKACFVLAIIKYNLKIIILLVRIKVLSNGTKT